MAEKLADQSDQVANASTEFMFTDEQQQLLDAVRRFCAENFGEANARRVMESDPPFDRVVWTRLGTELGVLGLSVPEADGGVGGDLVDQAVAVEQFGATLATGPLFGTVYLAVPALVAASGGEARDRLLAELVEGARTAAFAADATAVRADGDTLTGELGPVVEAGAADVLLVAATGADGVGLYAVEGDADGVERTPLITLDLTRPQAAVVLSGAPATLIAGPDEAPRVIEHALHVGAALLAVEQVGAAAHLLDLAVDYAKSRLQFGRPIGSFQAVKHRLADMLVEAEHARSTAFHAVWALADGSDDPALATAIAQATCSAALSRIATDTIQVLGGIGFTWEHQAHLYFKRAVTDAALLGSAEHHRDRVAEMVLDAAESERIPSVATGRSG